MLTQEMYSLATVNRQLNKIPSPCIYLNWALPRELQTLQKTGRNEIMEIPHLPRGSL